MDMNDYLVSIRNAMTVNRQEILNNSDQLTLGEMILKLEPIANKQKSRIEEGGNEAAVVFDFEYLYPDGIGSWRGSYDELALSFSDNTSSRPMKVSDFLKLLKDTVGKTFTGYKGGEYTMHKHTPVWVANHGHSGNTAIIEIVDNDFEVILMTGYREF